MRVRLSTDSQRGAVALLVALLSVVLFTLLGLVVDLGHARDVRREASNAADASALAAANQLYLNGVGTARITEAVAAAKSYAAANHGTTEADWASCTDPSRLAYVPTGGSPCISFDYSGASSAQPTTRVRVRIPTVNVTAYFSGIFGGPGTVPVAARAVAKVSGEARSRCGLCVTGTGYHDLQNGDAYVTGGDVHFNGDVNLSNNGLVSTTGSITVQGTANGSGYSPSALIGQPPIADPLAFLSLPPSMTGLTQKSNPCSDGPGLYGSYGFPNSTCTLQPGLYVIAGSGASWALNGNNSQKLLGSGVTLYFTCGTSSAPAACSSGQLGANLDASGNGQLGISAPTSGTLQGLAVVYDRNNTALLKLTGGGASSLSGTIYIAGGTLQMNGNGCSSTAIDSLVIVKNLEMNGNGACLNAAYNTAHNVAFPPGDLALTE